MAESTHTVATIGVAEIEGRKRYQRLLVDITSEAADGVALLAGDDGDGLSAFTRIDGVKILGQENGGYDVKYVVSTFPSNANPSTSVVGALKAYWQTDPADAGGADIVLAQAVGEDVGQVLVEVEGV